MSKVNLFDYSLSHLQEFFAEFGEPSYRAQQLILWMHQRAVIDFAQMTNLSKVLRDKLQAIAEIRLPEVIYRQRSADGTCKWLLRMADGNAIETVFIPEPDRGTLCVSSQVGCALNCSFCATAKEGFNRNLSLAEIIGQLWVAKQELAAVPDSSPVTNVVMMGMGEPLLNYQAVVGAMDLMLSDYAYGLSKYRVTLSTAGVVPALKQLREESVVALAVSLHAPKDDLRNQLVPLNRKYPLAELIPVCRDYYPAGSKRVVTFEYVMLANVNDSLQQAQQLAELLADVPCKLNLIPFNPFPNSNYESSSPEVINVFQNYLIYANIPTWVRKTRGQDIAAACGQLAGQMTDRTGRNLRWQRTGLVVPSKSGVSGVEIHE